MKHCDCSKAVSRRRLVISAVCCLLSVACLSACAKHEEVDFSGTLVDVRSCTSLNISADRNVAHIVALDTPAGVGGTYDTLTNVVVLYEPTRHITVGDRIHGTFYFDNNYSKTNCSWHNTDYDLPEGVFTKTYVD